MTITLVVPDFGDVTDTETIEQIFNDLTSLRDDTDELLLKATVRARKPSDQVLTVSSTTLQNVTGLSLPYAANAVYEGYVVGIWVGETGTAEDIKFGASFDALATLNAGGVGPHSAMGAAVAFGDGEFTQRLAMTSASTTVPFGASTATAGGIVFFDLTTGASAGTLQIMAAQNTSGVNDITVKGGSRIVMSRIS